MQDLETMQDDWVNLPELMARVENDHELLQEVFEIFKEQFPQMDLALRLALADGNLMQIQNSAHAIKGMLSSLSFTKASISAMHIERMARQGESAGISEELEEMERSVAKAQAQLDATNVQLIDLGVKAGIVEKSGSWFSYNSMRLGQGRDASKQFLKANPKLSAEIREGILGKAAAAPSDLVSEGGGEDFE